MINKVAQALSYLFHPLLIPTLALIYVMQADLGLGYQLTQYGQLILLGFVFCGTFLFPVLILLLMQKFGIIKDLYMRERRQRSYPFILIAALFYALTIMIHKVELPPIYYMLSTGMAMVVLIAMLINLFWKISIHMLSIGSLTGMIFCLSLIDPQPYYFCLVASLLISGVVGWARLTLEAHTPAQVYAGFLVGASTMSTLFYAVYL